MIGFIEGHILNIWGNVCIVLTQGGVGYNIILPAHTLLTLPKEREKVSFYTYTSVREDAIELYGFETLEERQTFEILKGINKVGSRTALSILSMFRPQELSEIVIQENLAALKKVSGIGQKTAQHILLELRYKLSQKSSKISTSSPLELTIYKDLMAALINLGYSEEECSSVVNEIICKEQDIDLPSAIRLVLRELGKGKSDYAG